MATRRTIIGRLGLLGASIGVFLGLFEACCLRLPDLSLPLMKPHVPFWFWFFAPLLTSVVFGLLGLLAGIPAAWLRPRFGGMLVIASFAGIMGDYFWITLRSYPSAAIWLNFVRGVVTLPLVFVVVFGCTLGVLWSTRKPNSPLGALADVPLGAWSAVVLGLMAVLAAAVAAGSLPQNLIGPATRASGRSSPNIVLMVWDTTRADHLSSYGYFRKTTPNLDEFARRGVLFENAISASNWTLPSMAAVFTSLLPHQHGASADAALGNGPRTLAEILDVDGYETAGFNANHYFGIQPWGLARGFETYTDTRSSIGYNLVATRLGDEFLKPYTEEWFHRSRFDEYNAHQLNERIYRWFNHRSDRPYFLFINYNDAHGPYEAPYPYNLVYRQASKRRESFPHTSIFGGSDPDSKDREGMLISYDQCLHYIDAQMEELLQFLQRSPQWSNTYVIIMADHGEGFGEHNTFSHGWDLYRQVVHVPLIVVGPGVPVGVRLASTASTRQVFSTVLQWAGLQQPVLHRTSLARFWDAHQELNGPEDTAVSQFIDASPPPVPRGMMSITTHEWHLIYERGDHRTKLYHWTTDPKEQQDVSGLPQNLGTVEALRAKILSLMESSYRPWRDTRYLEALEGPNFSPDDEARAYAPLLPGTPLLPPPIGAPQALFRANPETLQSHARKPDEDLLRSLPYGGQQ